MRFLLATMFCFLAIGCRTDQRCQRQTALLRAEILDLEDKYYSLKAKHNAVVGVADDAGQIVGEPYYDGVIYDGGVIYDEFPQETITYGGEVIHDGNVVYGEPILGGPLESGATTSGSAIDNVSPDIEVQQFGQEGSGAQSVVEPQTDPSVPSEFPESNTPEKLPAPADAQEGDQLGLQINSPSTRSAMPTEIYLEPSSTRGRDVDGIKGDEGLELLIQPRTAAGKVKLQAGELTISLIDPAETPDRQRIGLWKFLSEETKLFFASAQQENQGILLHLPWGPVDADP